MAPKFGLVVPLEQDDLAAGNGDIAPGRKPADPVMDVWPRCHIANIDITIVGEIRIDRHADEPALPVAIDLDLQKRRGSSDRLLDDAELPVCSQTKIRPSAATAIAVAPVIPVATRSLEKPRGKVIGPPTPLPGVPCPAVRRPSRYAIRSAKSRCDSPAGQPVGHQRCMAGHPFLDLRLADGVTASVGVDERQARLRTPL